MEKEVLLKNLMYLRSKEQTLHQLKKAQGRRIAALVCEHLRTIPLLAGDTVGDEMRLLFSQDVPDSAFFADICHEMVLQMPEVTPATFFPLAQGNEKETTVSYLKNAHSDRAYRIFAAHLPGASAIPAATSYSCCEDVSTGKATCCILPVHTEKSGILTTFCALAEQYDLFIHAITTVTDPQTEEATVFALFKRRCEWNPNKTFYAFGIPEELLAHCGKILCDVSALGATVLRVGALQTMDGGRAICLIVLDVGRADLTAILLYLEVAAKSHITLGLFEEWTDNE